MRTNLVIFCLTLAIIYVTAVPVSNQGDEDLLSSKDGPLARPKRTVGILRDLFPNFSQDENTVAESRVIPVRAKREVAKKELDEEEDSEDLESEATGDNEVANDNEADSSETDAEEDEEDEEDPRNKRFLNFNLGATADAQAGAAAGGSGSGGGSGNFLFDIIRLVAGSGQTPEGSGDGTATAALEEPKDGVGVPGPLTRLFVVANKGVAALIQDLILRLAQTSEKIVNFKARLITSII